MIYTYVMKLNKNDEIKYYIGKTYNPNIGLNDEEIICDWTIKYKPIKILELIPKYDDVDGKTLEYMSKFGIANVRGGKFSKKIIDHLMLMDILSKIFFSKEICSVCGKNKNKHYGCFLKDEDFDYDKLTKISQNKCSICKKIAHTENEHSSNNYRIPNNIYQPSNRHFYRNDFFDNSDEDDDLHDNSITCSKCYSPYHYTKDCFEA